MLTTDEASVMQNSRQAEDLTSVNTREPTTSQIKDDALVRFALLIFRIHKRRIGQEEFDRNQQPS
jgi:hypothetical protein